MKLPSNSAVKVSTKNRGTSVSNHPLRTAKQEEQSGEAHFTLGLVHEKNGNYVQAKNCFLNALCVARPHKGGEFKLIEVHRKLIQHSQAEDIGGVDRDSIVRALEASGDNLPLEMYLAELSLREGDFLAAMEQISECVRMGTTSFRQLLEEISDNLFLDSPIPDYPVRVFANIWQHTPSSAGSPKQKIVEMLNGRREIPLNFILGSDGVSVLKAALIRIQLGKDLDFFFEQLLFAIDLMAHLCIGIIEQNSPEKEIQLGKLLEIDTQEATRLRVSTLKKIRGICEMASAEKKCNVARVLLGNLIKMGKIDAFPFTSMCLKTIICYSERALLKASGREIHSTAWLIEVAQLIENVLVLQKKERPKPMLEDVVSPLLQCLLDGMTTEKEGDKRHFLGVPASLFRQDSRDFAAFKELASLNPEFATLCQKGSFGNLFK